MTRKYAIGSATAIGVMVLMSVVELNPLRSSPQSIRASLLKLTPIGAGVSEARNVVERKFGARARYNDKTGFVRQEKGMETVGSTSMEVHLGTYHEIPVPLATDVTAYWGFDTTGKLIDVWVWKTTDGP